jgi:DNA-binding NtrC family response regulator
MPVPMQAKLLQALQDGEFYRVGGQKKIKVETRVLVATNVDLARAMARGTFREDLYYRLNVVEVAIPPLRERRQDIPRLLEHFLDKYGRRYQRPLQQIPPEVMQRLTAYDFPGNIRELENLVRRLIVLGDPRYILGELRERPIEATSSPSPSPPSPSLPSSVPPTPLVPLAVAPPPGVPALPTQPMTYGYQPATPQPGLMTVTVPYETPNAPPGQIDDAYEIDLKELGRKAANAAEREAIIIMLRHTGGNKREAAERLGISYKAILYKIREFGIGRPRQRRAPVAAPRPSEWPKAEAASEDASDGGTSDAAVLGVG